MSDAALAEVEDTHRVGRRARSAEDRPLPEDTSTGLKDDLSPEEALAETRKHLETSEANLAAERERVAQAERERNEARQAAATATAGRINEREFGLGAAIEAASAAKQSATAALRAAREVGDFDAEMKAQEAFNAASYRFNRLAEDKHNFEAQKPALTEQARQQVQTPQPSSEAQRWIDEHPQFNTNRAYKAAATGAHSMALESGIAEGSRAYINFINDVLEETYGTDHGRAQSEGRTMEQRPSTQRRSSEAAPPSRASDSAFSYRDTDGSSLRLSKNADGKDVLSGTIPADWREGAAISGMSDVAYAIDRLKIIQEQKSGGNAGLVFGDGSVYS